jgi:hypothetical protein
MTYELMKVPAFSLLLGSFGASLLFALRKGESVHLPFERLVIGFLAITFYIPMLGALSELGEQLRVFVSTLGSKEALNTFISNALYSAATKFDTAHPLGTTGNMGNYLLQIFRTGVWGILSSITELIFVLAAFLIEVGRDALWEVILVLFPLGAAFIPMNPKIALGMALMAVELVLWLPILEIINIATSQVARRYSMDATDVGFRVLALELVAICLTFSVTIIAHKLVSGSLSGNLLEPWKKTAAAGTAIVMGAPRVIAGAAAGGLTKGIHKRLPIALLLFFGLSHESAFASNQINLKLGFLKKVNCKGRLYASGVGNESIVELEALPSNIGCGVILKPVRGGTTNLILETSTGTIEKSLHVPQKKVAVKK